MERICFYREHELWGELCNFYLLKTPIQYQNKWYPTSEHLYQSLKYLLKKDPTKADLEYEELIRTSSTPNKSKILANQNLGGKEYKWKQDLNEQIKKYKDLGVSPGDFTENEKIENMRIVLRLKFTTDLHCKKILLSTGSNILIEKSPNDTFWGDSSGGNNTGKNHLGKLLQEIREELQKTIIE